MERALSVEWNNIKALINAIGEFDSYVKHVLATGGEEELRKKGRSVQEANENAYNRMVNYPARMCIKKIEHLQKSLQELEVAKNELLRFGGMVCAMYEGTLGVEGKALKCDTTLGQFSKNFEELMINSRAKGGECALVLLRLKAFLEENVGLLYELGNDRVGTRKLQNDLYVLETLMLELNSKMSLARSAYLDLSETKPLEFLSKDVLLPFNEILKKYNLTLEDLLSLTTLAEQKRMFNLIFKKQFSIAEQLVKDKLKELRGKEGAKELKEQIVLDKLKELKNPPIA